MNQPEKFPIFLKGIHIQGFKSFADSVKLELGQGLSVIVGPNGSGKSNIADAVRWVLGEQSAKSLRGTKMEDVIFSGSTQRRPVGMAEVSLIFDNSTGIFPLDFREVTITRRVYRDGEGQYLINKAACRLKDVQELFMDTGAGKEGFSIIGQGRVEEILTLKSEERRSLIEEAAGITKYRSRKREALKRLDATNLNLQRIEDIIQEIEGQIAPLAAQAQVAEQSLALSREQKHLEIQGVVKDITDIKHKLSKAAQDQEVLQANLAESQAVLGLKETQSLKLKNELQTLENEIQQKQEKVYLGEQALNSLRHEQSLRNERFNYLNEQAAGLGQEILNDEGKVNYLQEQTQTLAAKQAVLKQTVQEAQHKVSVQEKSLAEIRENTLAKDIERIKGDLFQALTEQANCSNELTGARQALASAEQQLSRLEEEQALKEEEHRSLLATSQGEELGLRELAGEIQQDRQEEQRLKAELDKLRNLRQEKAHDLQKHKTTTDQSKARLHALQSLEDSLEGYQRGVREVMKAKKKGIQQCQGLCGTVADLINVEEKYELAIETALGAGMQNVVADNEEAAKSAIAYLKSHQLGRVTFLPLDVIQGYRMSVSRAVETDKGYVGLAVDLVHYADTYRPAMEFLLGRIVIVKDMDAATRIARASGYKLRIVTLEGDQVNPGGSLSGGSIQRKGGNLLARTREIETLRSTLGQLERELTEKEKEWQEYDQQLRRAQEQLEGLQTKLRTAQEQKVKLEAAHENILSQIRRLTGDLLGLSLRHKEAAAQKEELLLRLTDLTKRAEAAEKTSLRLREEFNQRESEAKIVAEQIDASTEKLTQEKIQLAKWEQELAQCQVQLEQQQKDIRENQLKLTEKKEKKAAIEENRRNLEIERESIGQQLVSQSQLHEEQQYALMQSRQAREELSSRVLEIEQEVNTIRQGTHTIEQRLHANEIKVVRWETESQGGLNRLTEEFSLTWEEGIEYQTDEDRNVLWTKIQSLKQQIEELGPINQAAIEEYPKILKRNEFMLTQQNDLVEASQTLLQLIAELDKTMSERFIESFNAVNMAFQEVFKELFNGGHAELQLVNPELILETGVEIIAQPPGKRPQLLSLLSGGERALTAIAVLFALLRVKPSPFCILDEIEASLDDANVNRFAQYLRRLSHSTQFVVVSHRKGTMEAADILYGITMEECGVSKLLSVKIDGRQENHESA
ncbi:chromosome segregation protein SMC [Desulfosporosinus orientis DSM 765]|uniref:Chromosome partition protein Smc n=1 Tax=Desulfosporosinus orientis (strain ATCC 19365 / DSM 765 / NCIMB 8382 / VKM B-1628 / Singapore I) TaxID=768706 RepID=G7WEC5_DESOD|nr:chromosome segregation protein SMC [Desulfosporosinus orientis]AET70101.1 chromosome segregation protein SMC [Desulfosporosinus orientis DSM 765]